MPRRSLLAAAATAAACAASLPSVAAASSPSPGPASSGGPPSSPETAASGGGGKGKGKGKGLGTSSRWRTGARDGGSAGEEGGSRSRRRPRDDGQRDDETRKSGKSASAPSEDEGGEREALSKFYDMTGLDEDEKRVIANQVQELFHVSDSIDWDRLKDKYVEASISASASASGSGSRSGSRSSRASAPRQSFDYDGERDDSFDGNGLDADSDDEDYLGDEDSLVYDPEGYHFEGPSATLAADSDVRAAVSDLDGWDWENYKEHDSGGGGDFRVGGDGLREGGGATEEARRRSLKGGYKSYKSGYYPGIYSAYYGPKPPRGSTKTMEARHKTAKTTNRGKMVPHWWDTPDPAAVANICWEYWDAGAGVWVPYREGDPIYAADANYNGGYYGNGQYGNGHYHGHYGNGYYHGNNYYYGKGGKGKGGKGKGGSKSKGSRRLGSGGDKDGKSDDEAPGRTLHYYNKYSGGGRPKTTSARHKVAKTGGRPKTAKVVSNANVSGLRWRPVLCVQGDTFDNQPTPMVQPPATPTVQFNPPTPMPKPPTLSPVQSDNNNTTSTPVATPTPAPVVTPDGTEPTTPTPQPVPVPTDAPVPFVEYAYSRGNCPNPGSTGVPCADDLNLRFVCDKYAVEGSFRQCWDSCKPSFCCIHDADPELNFIAPNCNQDENCAQYAYCYIIWWKLHDTIGPALYLRAEQDDDFYDVPAEEIEGDKTTDEHFRQVIMHHFDDVQQVITAGTENNQFVADIVFDNPDWWEADV